MNEYTTFAKIEVQLTGGTYGSSSGSGSGSAGGGDGGGGTLAAAAGAPYPKPLRAGGGGLAAVGGVYPNVLCVTTGAAGAWNDAALLRASSSSACFFAIA